jgi:hypothetical protein
MMPGEPHTYKYSVDTMAKAIAPGNKMTSTVNIAEPLWKCPLPKTLFHPSTPRLTGMRIAAIRGASQKIVAKGLERPMLFFFMRVSVIAQRRPESADAEKTMMMPGMLTEVVSKTMRKTPAEMRVMTPTRWRENRSSRNRKAKRRTKIRAEDLHIAEMSERCW